MLLGEYWPTTQATHAVEAGEALYEPGSHGRHGVVALGENCPSEQRVQAVERFVLKLPKAHDAQEEALNTYWPARQVVHEAAPARLTDPRAQPVHCDALGPSANAPAAHSTQAEAPKPENEPCVHGEQGVSAFGVKNPSVHDVHAEALAALNEPDGQAAQLCAPILLNVPELHIAQVFDVLLTYWPAGQARAVVGSVVVEKLEVE